jgi:hypothetical protein
VETAVPALKAMDDGLPMRTISTTVLDERLVLLDYRLGDNQS